MIIHGGVITFKSNFPFHNIFIYNRATFNDRVASCIDFLRESWHPVEASYNEFRKISVFKIPTNSKTTNCLCKNIGNTCDGVRF